MKILIYGVNYAPELTGIGKYTGEMAEWLVKQGHEIRVVTAPPYYPKWKITESYSSFFFSKEVLNGVSVTRCPLYVPRSPSGLKRLMHLASFSLSSSLIMFKNIFWKSDVILVIEPPLFCAPIAWVVARLSGSKCWLHVQDFEVDAAFSLGLIRFSWMKWLVSRMECQLLRLFDSVSTISYFMLEKLREKGVKESHLAYFPNWVDFNVIQYSLDEGLLFRKEHHIDIQKFIILYSGNIGQKQGLDIILEAALRVKNKNILFLICGEGAMKTSLVEKSEKMNLDNVMFLPLQPVCAFSGMLSAANLHLVLNKRGVSELVMPSKLTNILAVGGRSIISAEENSELGLLVKKHPFLGSLCPPEDLEEFIMQVNWWASTVNETYNAQIGSFAQNNLDLNKIMLKVESQFHTLSQ